MYIYHALINTLSAHMIHINLNARQLKRAAPAWLSWTKSNLTEGFLVLFLSWCTQTRRIYTNTVCFLLPLLFVKGHFVEILHQSKTIFLFLFFFISAWRISTLDTSSVSAFLYCYWKQLQYLFNGHILSVLLTANVEHVLSLAFHLQKEHTKPWRKKINQIKFKMSMKRSKAKQKQ